MELMENDNQKYNIQKLDGNGKSEYKRYLKEINLIEIDKKKQFQWSNHKMTLRNKEIIKH